MSVGYFVKLQKDAATLRIFLLFFYIYIDIQFFSTAPHLLNRINYGGWDLLQILVRAKCMRCPWVLQAEYGVQGGIFETRPYVTQFNYLNTPPKRWEGIDCHFCFQVH